MKNKQQKECLLRQNMRQNVALQQPLGIAAPKGANHQVQVDRANADESRHDHKYHQGGQIQPYGGVTRQSVEKCFGQETWPDCPTVK